MKFTRYLTALFTVGVLATGCGGSAGEGVSVSPPNLDFGRVVLGDTATAGLDVANGGKKAAQLVSATIGGNDSGAFSHGLALPIYLVEESSVTLTFSFAPEELGDAAATLTLGFEDGSGRTLNLTGEGIEEPTPTGEPTPTAEPTPVPTPIPGDIDGDGFNPSMGDCNENDANINPDAEEICGDTVDQDCSGVADDGPDADNDGYIGCGEGNDCDDTLGTVYPGAQEVCNGMDDDCDGLEDEDFDQDGDGVSTCHTPPDCNDTNPNTAPGKVDGCIPGDNDCDGTADEDAGDIDGDGVGDCDDNCPVYVEASDTPVDQTDGSAANPFPTINAGVLNRGDCATVWVLPGEYTESVVMPLEDISLEAIQGPEQTTLFAAGGPALVFQSAQTSATVVKGFTITGSGESYGSCAKIVDSSPTLEGNHFNACSSGLSGGAVHILGGAPTLLENDFTGNSAPTGGAVHAQGAGTQLVRNLFTQNEATEGNGGAVLMKDEVDAVVSGNLFQANSADGQCGAIRAEGTVGLSVQNNNFTENIATGDGGAVGYQGGTELITSGNTFTSNQSTGTVGAGAAYVYQVSGATLSDETYTTNYATGGGGGLLVLDADEVYVDGASFIGNIADKDGGGLRGAEGSTLYVTNSLFQDNAGNTGGGMSAVNDGYYEVSLSTFTTNASTAGGAGVWYASSVQGEIRQSVFTGNQAEINGGAIYILDCSPTIRNNIIAGNKAVYTVPLTGQGGAIYVSIGAPVVQFNTVVANTAMGGGGGIIWSTNSDGIRLDLNLIYGNEAGANKGGGCEAYDGTASFSYNNLFGNIPANYGGYESFPTKKWTDQTGNNGNLSVDPLFVAFSDDDDYTNDDYHLSVGSQCIDAAPNRVEFKDVDGSLGDVGAYGGPFGDW